MRRSTLPCLLFAVVLFQFEPSPANAGVNKCVGPDGATIYSDAPCDAGTQARQIQTDSSATSPTSSTLQVQRAIYASPRDGRKMDVTNQVRFLCVRGHGACSIRCGNQLGGDPDFGQRKYCRVSYQCGGARPQELTVQEGENLLFRCGADALATNGPGLPQGAVPRSAIRSDAPTIAAQPFTAPASRAISTPGAGGAGTEIARNGSPNSTWNGTPGEPPQALQRQAIDPRATGPKTQEDALFQYYVIALHWLPTLCADDPAADECLASGRKGFGLGGLWPHKDWASPVRCDVRRELPDSLVQSVSDLFPTRALVEREWKVHGSCTGIEPDEYFALARKAYDSIALPDFFGPYEPKQRTIHTVVRSFRALDHGLPEPAIIVTCTNEAQARLKDVLICLDKRNLGSFYCRADVIAAGCRTLNLLVPEQK